MNQLSGTDLFSSLACFEQAGKKDKGEKVKKYWFIIQMNVNLLKV